MSFKIEDNIVLVKYNEHWNRVKQILNIKLHEKHIKAKVKTFNEVVDTVFLDNKISKESIHYICVAGISIDCVIKIHYKNYPQVYLEERKYKINKHKMIKFIKAE